MSSINTPKELLATKGIDYDSLPVLPEKNKVKYLGHIVKKVALTALKMTVIGALVLFAFKLLAEKIVRSSTLDNKKLTPLGKQRLQETEEKIRSIAKKAGIINPQKIKLCVMNSRSPAAAIGKSTIITSPEYLVQPKDLPEELNFARLDNQKLTEEEWVVKFNEWVRNNIMVSEKKSSKPKSQLEVDASIEFGKAFLRMYRDRDGFEKAFEAVVGHELGHCSHNHSFKHALADFGWDLLALPTLGISTLFHDKVLQPLHKKHEIEADLFSNSKFGPEGLIRFFKEFSEAGKVLHEKYPQKYDENGGNKYDHQHPHLGERIVYLNMLELSKGYMDIENLSKRIKGAFA